jgi:hypothetical protein
MAYFVDACKFIPQSSGSGDFVVAGPALGYQTPASAGAVDGKVYRYRAEISTLQEWEVGYGVYTAATLTLARTTVLYNSLGSTSPVNFSIRPRVAITALARDIPQTIDMEMTAGTSLLVDVDASVVRVNKTVGSATTIVMPLSEEKVCDVLISDWKMDASTNPITINLSGSETFPGGLTSWVISADGGSVFLRRIPGVGYAI